MLFVGNFDNISIFANQNKRHCLSSFCMTKQNLELGEVLNNTYGVDEVEKRISIV